jgi:hypothetical protein
MQTLPAGPKITSDLPKNSGAPGRIRTCDTGFRRAVLYPLSYEGGRAELTGRPLPVLRSAQLRDHLREVLDVIVLHGKAGQPVFFAVAGQGVGHLAG